MPPELMDPTADARALRFEARIGEVGRRLAVGPNLASDWLASRFYCYKDGGAGGGYTAPEATGTVEAEGYNGPSFTIDPLPGTVKECNERHEALVKRAADAKAAADASPNGTDWALMSTIFGDGDAAAMVAEFQRVNYDAYMTAQHMATLGEAGKQLDGLMQSRQALNVPTNRITPGGPRDGGPGETQRRASLGEAFVEQVGRFQGGADAYVQAIRNLKGPGQGFGLTLPGATGVATDMDTYQRPGQRDTLFQRSAGWDPEVRETGIVVLDPDVELYSVLNRMPVIPTNQDTVRYRQWDTGTARPAERAEGATSVELALTTSVINVPVEHIAAHLPITEEELVYVPGIAARLDQQAEALVAERVAKQWLMGNGTAPNVRGVAQIASGLQSRVLTKVAADQPQDVLDKALQLFAAIRAGGKANPDVAIANSTLWAQVQGTKDSQGRYLYGDPQRPGPRILWGVPVDISPDLTTTGGAAARALVAGAFRLYSATYLAADVSVQYGTVGDQFEEFEVTMRIGIRAVPVWYRPQAFGYLSVAP